jgi:hypothetical protein
VSELVRHRRNGSARQRPEAPIEVVMLEPWTVYTAPRSRVWSSTLCRTLAYPRYILLCG